MEEIILNWILEIPNKIERENEKLFEWIRDVLKVLNIFHFKDLVLWSQFVYEIWSLFWDQALGSRIGNKILFQSAVIPNSWYQPLLSVTCWLLRWQFWESAFLHCPFFSGIFDLFPSPPPPPPPPLFSYSCLHIPYLHGNCWRWLTSSLAEDILPILPSASLIHHRSDRNTYRMNWQLFSLQLHWL